MLSGRMINITDQPGKTPEHQKLRVAAYARVSADMEMKLLSLGAQEDYFHEAIAAHPDWELVGVYTDSGISDTTFERPGFQRLMENCRADKIDLIITRSVTRFARNTIDLLQTIRELSILGIDCYFERENLHSASLDSEFLSTISAICGEEKDHHAFGNQSTLAFL